MQVIGFTGPAGCGKTTAANRLYASDPTRYTVAPLGWPIKQMLSIGLGLDPDAKTEVLPVAERTGRYLMQTLGTEWGRAVHPDLWLRVFAERHARETRVLLIDDVRFENEATMVRHYGLLVHIERPGHTYSMAHASERGIASRGDRDYTITDNDLASVWAAARCL